MLVEYLFLVINFMHVVYCVRKYHVAIFLFLFIFSSIILCLLQTKMMMACTWEVFISFLQVYSTKILPRTLTNIVENL